MRLRRRFVKWGQTATLVAITAFATWSGLKWSGVDFSPLAANPSYHKFLQTYSRLTESYYEKLNPNQLMEGAISGMVHSVGDPFSMYMNPVLSARFRELVSSEFQGIGAVLSEQNGQLVVATVLPGSPAAKAGLERNDAVLSINGRATGSLSLEQAVELIRGKAGTSVRLKVMRGQSVFTRDVLRQKIVEPTVFMKLYPHHIGYLLITEFSENTDAVFLNDLEQLKQNGVKGLIIDVRDDPGGYLQSVDKIASYLLPKNAVIAQIAGRDGARKVLRANGDLLPVPKVCLVNGETASAGEILAAALQESGGVPLVGERTYGKGTVQETEQFKDGSSLKLTVARWLTPKGVWIHRKGIAPNFKVPTPTYYHYPALPMSLRTPYKIGDNQVSIAVLQRILLALHYFPGRTDGYYSQSTYEAVMAFQRAHQLKPTGEVDGSTAYALNVALLQQKQNNDPQLLTAVGYIEHLIIK